VYCGSVRAGVKAVAEVKSIERKLSSERRRRKRVKLKCRVSDDVFTVAKGRSKASVVASTCSTVW